MNRPTIALIVIVVGIIIAGFVFNTPTPVDTVPKENVSVVDGVQIVEVLAKGGYFPGKSVAQAGIPTTLRFSTKGTFDCSSIVRLPTLDITENLPPTGTLDIDLGVPEKGLFRGSCGMGMYPFEIDFQ